MKKILIIGSLSLLVFSSAIFAQTKKNTRVEKPESVTTATPPESKTPGLTKHNERPGASKTADNKSNTAYKPTYFFEFERPGFSYPWILIEHDAAGNGKISFKKDGYDEVITDPISLSAATITSINQAYNDLNFIDSTESYQYPKDFSNMGNNTFTLKKDGKERTAKYNWTDNKSAKILMDEYRRIGNEYTWKFEFSVARENQPLLTPGMMEGLDSYVQRSEISDPEHIVPFLSQLSTDERLPLMVRNRATKLIAAINKKKGEQK